MAEFEYDFSGWATKNGVMCSDGRTIERDAFKGNHGKYVPLVFQHKHDEVTSVIGHALLENRKEGVYAYCSLNDSYMADHARSCIKHKDLQALSIYAKVDKEVNKHVTHGSITELSLVLKGANPGALIDNVVMHADGSADEIFTFYDDENCLGWSAECGVVDIKTELDDDTEPETEPEKQQIQEEASVAATIEHSEEGTKMADEKTTGKEKTVEDVLNELTPEQSKIVEYVITRAVEAALNGAVKHSEEENAMTSIFENNAVPQERPQIAPEDVKDILKHAAQSNCGSLKVAVNEYLAAVNDLEQGTIAHADDNPGGVERSDTTGVTYGIAGIDWLFPNAHQLYNTPDFIKRRTEWVNTVMTGVKDVPFARIKSMFTDITADAARAKGYTVSRTNPHRKVEEVVSLLRRETTPTTIYKKQKLDRDDIIDITDFDVVLYLKGEMRLMWEEENARAILIGDGRTALDNDKIDETKIRPIYTDDELFTIPVRYSVPAAATDDQRIKLAIRAFIKGMDDYEGSGNLTFFTTASFLSDCLLLEDGMGRPMYDSIEKLKTALHVNRIVTVPVMKNISRSVTINGSAVTEYLDAIVVDLSDYVRGADRGGKAEMFEDFDIDYNQYKYLYEGRCSGALVKPHSAIVLEHSVAQAQQSNSNSSNSEQPAG